MHLLCKDSAAETYQSAQVLESTRLLFDLIQKPEEYEGWFERFASGLIFRIGFGRVMRDNNDPMLKRLFTEVKVLERVASPGSYLVDTFPILMYLPDWLAPFKRELKALHLEELDIMRGLLYDVKEEMKQGKAPKCWEKTYIENMADYGLTEDQGAYVVGSLFEGKCLANDPFPRHPCSPRRQSQTYIAYIANIGLSGSCNYLSCHDVLGTYNGALSRGAEEASRRNRQRGRR